MAWHQNTIKKFIKKIVNKFSLINRIKWRKLPNGVYCFNYHRIGDSNSSDFDPNIFSCTAKQFEQHLQFYKSQFTVISMEQLVELAPTHTIDKKYAVITFDDGYIDNYTIAFPLLIKHGLTAAFYVVTDYTSKPTIPWWDEIAWIVRKTQLPEVKLSHWEKPVDIKQGTIKERVRRLLKVIKADDKVPMDQKISMLQEICMVKLDYQKNQQSLFMNYQQLAEMHQQGMHVGSHTCSHNILAHLDDEQQTYEIRESKINLESKLKCNISTIAYPVGNSDTFTQHTQNKARESGYSVGFSFIPGIIKSLDNDNIYQLKRIPVDDNCSTHDLKSVVLNLCLKQF